MDNKIKLDYTFNELEPYLLKSVLEIHYNIYIKNLEKLNLLLENVSYDTSLSLRDLVKNIDIFPLNVRGDILYYLSSILNHNLYFYNISNRRNVKPMGKILVDINRYFGSYEEFKRLFKEKALNLKGSGYTFLVLDEKGKLVIINTSNEDSPYYYGFVPIMVLDLWEHAYFLQYKDNKEKYIDSFFEILDFEKINNYYEGLVKR